MCLECKFCRWLECISEELTEEEVEMLENGELDENNCPHFVPYWANERNPYEPID